MDALADESSGMRGASGEEKLGGKTTERKENILTPKFDAIGLGAVPGAYQQFDDRVTMYTMVFGDRR